MTTANTYKTLLVEDYGSIRLVTINRPKALNALNPTVIDELTQVFQAIAEAKDVGGAVITGAGEKSFIAGADIVAMAEMAPEDAKSFAQRGHAFGELLASLPIPVIAAVNGFALGGGCEVALACDFIYASEKARFGQPEVNLGVIPGFGGTQRLLRRVGLARALELCMSGDIIKADEALRIGLCNRVAPHGQVVEEAIKTATNIASKGPLAVASAKRVLHQGANLELPAANQLEVDAFAQLFASADQREGMAAFLAKRPPAFSGK
ncbi:MAG: enoyl-CoA hydratase/isomerase family protein [Nannocystaceae bacterium]